MENNKQPDEFLIKLKEEFDKKFNFEEEILPEQIFNEEKSEGVEEVITKYKKEVKPKSTNNKYLDKMSKDGITEKYLEQETLKEAAEKWVNIVNYEGLYQISDLGNVKSLSRTITKGNITYVTKDRILKQSIDSVGYPYVNLSDYKRQKKFRVHQLVAIYFLNHTPDRHKGLVIDHIDGNKLNNNLTNLQLITNKINTSKDRKNKTSKYTGVSWHKQSDKWLAQFRENGSIKCLGTFETEEEARDAYNASQKRSYSEEEVLKLLISKEENTKDSTKYNGVEYITPEEWLKQFKKK